MLFSRFLVIRESFTIFALFSRFLILRQSVTSFVLLFRFLILRQSVATATFIRHRCCTTTTFTQTKVSPDKKQFIKPVCSRQAHAVNVLTSHFDFFSIKVNNAPVKACVLSIQIRNASNHTFQIVNLRKFPIVVPSNDDLPKPNTSQQKNKDFIANKVYFLQISLKIFSSIPNEINHLLY